MGIDKLRDWAIVLFVGSQLLLNMFNFGQSVLISKSQDQQIIQELQKKLQEKEKK